MPTQNNTESVLSLLCRANRRIDEITRREGIVSPLPKIERNTLNHHVVALAGILRRTNARSLTAQVGSIIVEARTI